MNIKLGLLVILLVLTIATSAISSDKLILSCDIEGSMWTFVVDFQNNTVNNYNAKISNTSIEYLLDGSRITIDRYSGQVVIFTPSKGPNSRGFIYRGNCVRKENRKF